MGNRPKFLCWLFGHKMDSVSPQSKAGLRGVRSVCIRCLHESTEEMLDRCTFCGKRAVKWNPIYDAGQCVKCGEVN